MDAGLITVLERDYDKWVESPDGTQVIAWKLGNGKTQVYDAETGEKTFTINAEYDHWAWLPDGRLLSRNHVITTLWDAKTGKMLGHIEATYDME